MTQAAPLPPDLRQRLLRTVLLPLALTWVAGTVVSFAVAQYFAQRAFDRSLLDDAYLLATHVRLEGGRLTFENAAVRAGVAKPPETYRASWFRFDNATGESQPISDTQGSTTTLDAPSGLPSASGSFVRVDISADSDGHPTWKKPVHTYFRRGANGWKLVGLERMPDKPPAAGVQHTRYVHGALPCLSPT